MQSKIEHRLSKLRWEAGRRPQPNSSVMTDNYADALQAHINGSYDEAIRLTKETDGWQSSAAAHRILGHALCGKEEFDAAIDKHEISRQINLDAGKLEAAAEDEVNIASVLVRKMDYDGALEAHQRALRLRPNFLATKLGMISILNRQERTTDLRTFLERILDKDPSLARDATMLDHLKNDTDFVGVDTMINAILKDKLED